MPSELPPRARRILHANFSCTQTLGTTSACAENTILWPASMVIVGNYLRVRGEYRISSESSKQSMELPPRARRIRVLGFFPNQSEGTTSACAENTGCEQSFLHRAGNYLRVRGEYHGKNNKTSFTVELPPRARRILISSIFCSSFCGTTSACAENTVRSGHYIYGKRNYLRVRGEYTEVLNQLAEKEELPPRARRIRWRCQRAHRPPGTTSACAENTV